MCARIPSFQAFTCTIPFTAHHFFLPLSSLVTSLNVALRLDNHDCTPTTDISFLFAPFSLICSLMEYILLQSIIVLEMFEDAIPNLDELQIVLTMRKNVD